jgi:hypothetical protein
MIDPTSCQVTEYSVQLSLRRWQNPAKMRQDHLGFQNAVEPASCHCNYASFLLSPEESYSNQENKRQDHLWIEWEADLTSCLGTEYSVQQLSLRRWQNLAKTRQDQHSGFQNTIKSASCNCNYASFPLSPEERY